MSVSRTTPAWMRSSLPAAPATARAVAPKRVGDRARPAPSRRRRARARCAPRRAPQTVTAAAVPQSRSPGGSGACAVRQERLARRADQQRPAERARGPRGSRAPRGCASARLAKPIPGSRMTCARGTPAAVCALEGLLQLRRHLRDDVVVARLAVHVPRPPARVHQDERRHRCAATTSPSFGSYPKPLMSFTIEAPAATAARATAAL